MLHLSTKNLQRYELPPVEQGGESALTAVYAVASMGQLAQILHDIQEAGVRPVSPREFRGHLRDYLMQLDDDFDRQRALHLLDARDRGVNPDPRPEVAGKKKKPRKGTDEARALAAAALADLELMATVRRTASAVWDPYRAALADSRLYQRVSAMCAVRRLLRGLEGPDAERMRFSAPHGLVDDATMKRLGFSNLEKIGEQILQAAQVSEDEAKN